MYALRPFWAHCQDTYIRMDNFTPAQFSFSLPLISLTCGTHTSGFFNLPPSLSSHVRSRSLQPGQAPALPMPLVPCSPHAAPSPDPLRRRIPGPTACSRVRRPRATASGAASHRAGGRVPHAASRRGSPQHRCRRTACPSDHAG
jgi:hypothetical protein